MKTAQAKPYFHSRGFTMVEVLVALVVLSVGMLGIAGLYVITLRSSGSAIYRMQAVSLATDITDRIRANRTGNVNYNGPPAPNVCFGALAVADCAPAAMAAADLFVWNAQLAQALPGGTGVVTAVPTALVVSGLPVFQYTVTVSWIETSASPQSYSMSVQI